MEKRIERTCKRNECDERQAVKIIDQNDQERSGFHKFFFDCNWEDPGLYDLVINTGSLSAEAAARIIQDVAGSDEFTSRQKETLLKLDDLSLEHEIKTNIIYKEKLSIHFLEVFSEQGVVTLRGIAGDSRDVEECEKIAAGMKNVKEVHNDVLFKPIATTYGLHY
jgi:osmotically-inducible protein OsmY